MVPTCLRAQERFHLIDAGLLMNVAYPPFLGEKRDIDLIIAPEYSAGNVFEVGLLFSLCPFIMLLSTQDIHSESRFQKRDPS